MKNKSLKRMLFSLVLLIQVPGVFYLIYEYNSVQDSEHVLNEIYTNQLNITIFSVNQFAWDVTRSWFQKSEDIINQPESKSRRNFKLTQLANNTTGIHSITILDSLFHVMYQSEKTDHDFDSSGSEIINKVRSEQGLINRLIRYESLDYSKTETLNLTISEKTITLFVAIISDGNQLPCIGIIWLDDTEFIQTILSQRLAGSAGGQFDFAIFSVLKNETVYTTDPVSENDFSVRKQLWILPDYQIGIKQKGPSISDTAKNRFYRNISLLLGLNIFLLLASVLVYRTIRKETELAEMRTDFVSNVSHELRTPLALIRMFAETLEMGRIKEESKKTEYYRTIISESERLTRLINNILSFAKMEKGKYDFHFAVTDVNGIIRKIMVVYRPQLEQYKFDLNLQLCDTPVLVNGDEELLTEAFQNIIDNAVKYSMTTKYLEIRTTVSEHECTVSFLDKGIGISADHHKKIFEKFYRVSSGLVHTAKGSGVGLALVKYIVEAHKGKIELTSEPDKGSEFILRFPKSGNQDSIS